MIAQNAGHIVNTASIAGLISAHGSGTYAVSKFAVVALSEVLLGDLKAVGADVGVSVLCPSFVNTRLYDFERNRPGGPAVLSDQAAAEQEAAAAFFAEMMSPDVVAGMVFDAIESGRFYILTHPEGTREMLDARLTAIKNQQSPKVISMMDWPLS
jgi:short-subunit dehydrogenase